jgi:hypothetical protein
MEKILNDRLNHLKSDLATAMRPKFTKFYDNIKIVELNARISEIEWLIYKYNKSVNDK